MKTEKVLKRAENVLRLESAERLEVFGKNPERTRFFAVEERRVEVRERLQVHDAIISHA